jgi:16S rRNA (cytosine967-C5)-methyltransferase
LKYLSTQMDRLEGLLKTYNGRTPLIAYLKLFFKEHRNMGSSDRRRFTAMAMAHFRMAGAQDMPTGTSIPWGMALGGSEDDAHTGHFRETLGVTSGSWAEMLAAMQAATGWKEAAYFPAYEGLTDQLPVADFIQSHVKPSSVFLRIAPGRTEAVVAELNEKGWPFSRPEDHILQLEGHHPLHLLASNDKGWWEIQDIASQQTGSWWTPEPGQLWFDCCAGSGGKSLQLLEQEPAIKLVVNDNRAPVLDELQYRFDRAGVAIPKMMQADLSEGIYEGLGPFDGIIADLPCSGSGTWGRTPERLRYFREKDIEKMAGLQRAIIGNVAKVLAPGGKLYYITCSVYAAENEQNVEIVCRDLQLQCTRQTYHNYHAIGGDTLYIAELMAV